MKVLTLQITKDNFNLILKGEQKIETRYIYPNTAKRYFSNIDKEDEKLKLIKYDALYLINGRRKDSPRLKVEVTGEDWFILQDDDGNDHIYEENGETYLVSKVEYSLGKIIETENIV